ncbi:MAG: hypothetical protein GX418_00910 [Clostridiales bacterium]|nr:hypothetical protein [Clostridiales bacterium]
MRTGANRTAARRAPSEYSVPEAKRLKSVQRHLWEDYSDQSEEIRHSDVGKALYPLRSETIERALADAKEKHAVRYPYYRGLPGRRSGASVRSLPRNINWRCGVGTPPFFVAFSVWRCCYAFYLFVLISKNPCFCFETRVL